LEGFNKSIFISTIDGPQIDQHAITFDPRDHGNVVHSKSVLDLLRPELQVRE
jgi:hypothetical protein